MSNAYNPDNFPLDALPPILLNAVREAQSIVKAPFPLVVSSAFGSMSLCLQSSIKVRRFNGMESSCSLYTMCIALSGERKSTLDKYFTKPIRDMEAAQVASMKEIFGNYTAAKMSWDAERKGLLSAIEANAKKGVDCSALTQQLADLIANKPVEPRCPKWIYRVVTMEALALGLQQWPSGGIFSDEGGALFDSRTFSNLGVFNLLWECGEWTIDRISDESIIVKEANLTMSIMVQPQTFGKFLERKGSYGRDSGFLARFFICWPISTQGYRYEDNLPPITNNGIQAFQDRLTEILRSSVGENGEFIANRKVLEFSDEGKALCVEFTNRVESALSVNGYLSDVKDAAAKLADNMARLAALFHRIQGNDGLIERETVGRAIRICEWYIQQFKTIFGAKYQLPQDQADAILLEDWLFSVVRRFGWTVVKKNFIRQYGPNQLRDKARLFYALNILATSNKVSFSFEKKSCNVHFGPWFFQQQPNAYMPGYLQQPAMISRE